MEVEIQPNLPDLYRRKVARLQQVLADEAARPQVVENHYRRCTGPNHCFHPTKNDRRLLERGRYVLDGCGGKIYSRTYFDGVEKVRLRFFATPCKYCECQACIRGGGRDRVRAECLIPAIAAGHVNCRAHARG